MCQTAANVPPQEGQHKSGDGATDGEQQGHYHVELGIAGLGGQAETGQADDCSDDTSPRRAEEAIVPHTAGRSNDTPLQGDGYSNKRADEYGREDHYTDQWRTPSSQVARLNDSLLHVP